MEDILQTNAVEADITLDRTKCYLCDNELEGEQSWLIFRKQRPFIGSLEEEECPLVAILSSALDRELDENTAHSKLLCNACNTIVMEYGDLEQRLYEIRFRILTEYNKTAIRNGLTPISIEIDGVVQRTEAMGLETEQPPYPSPSAEQRPFTLPKEDDLIAQLQVKNEFVIIGVDDGIALKSLVEEANSTESNDYAYELLSTADVKDGELLKPANIKKEKVQLEEAVDVTCLTNSDNTVDQEIVYDAVEPNSQIIQEDDASADGQYIEVYNSSNNNTSDMYYENLPAITEDCTEIDILEIERKVVGASPDYEGKGSIYSCALCPNKTEYSSKWFSEHMRKEHNHRFYICEHCDSVFFSRQEFNEHMEEQKHGSFECTTCRCTFPNYRQFRAHKRTHTATKQFECPECRKTYNSKSLLDGHMNMHTGDRPYKCTECCKDFASKYTLQTHLKIHSERQRPYQCDQCDKAFLNQQNLAKHRKLHAGVKAFVCDVCSKAFGTQHNLSVHQIVHSGHKPFICRTCNKAFARRAEIRDHERTHTGERPFQCDLCPMAFAQRSNLTSHKKSTHLNEKLHTCQHCQRSFKRRRLLEYHIQSTHTGERPHKCDVCAASFVYPEHLKKHTLIHLGVKPYACEVCGKQFNSRDNRNAHRFVHSNKKPYECLDCGLGFMRKPQLLQHMKQTQHSNDTIIINQPQIDNLILGDIIVKDENLMIEEVNAEELSSDVVDTTRKHLHDGNADILQNMEDDSAENKNKECSISQADQDITYLKFEEAADEAQQSLTWVDIDSSSS